MTPETIERRDFVKAMTAAGLATLTAAAPRLSSDTFQWIPIKLLDFADDIAGLEADENVFSLFVAAHLLTRMAGKDYEQLAEHKLRLLCNLEDRTVEDGVGWYRVIDKMMALPTDLNRRVHQELSARRGATMKYVSFAEQMGIEKGREIGREEGEVIGRIRTCQEMLGVSPTSSEELGKLELAELQRRAEELWGQLSPNRNGMHASS